jgi:hypothetical protein
MFNTWDDFFSIRKQPDESLSTLIARIEDGMSKIKELRPVDPKKPYTITDLDAELILKGNGAQTRSAQTKKDKNAVEVQMRKVREKELNQYESEIRRQCSRVGRVYQNGNEEKWNRTS